MTTWLNWDFSKVCMPVEHGKASADRLAAACWWFTFSKSIELIDTVSTCQIFCAAHPLPDDFFSKWTCPSLCLEQSIENSKPAKFLRCSNSPEIIAIKIVINSDLAEFLAGLAHLQFLEQSIINVGCTDCLGLILVQHK